MFEYVVIAGLTWLLYKLYTLHYAKNYAKMMKLPHSLPMYPVFGTYVPPDMGALREKFLKDYAQYPSPLMRKLLGTFNVQVYTPEHVEAVLTNSKNLTKSFIYEILSSWLGNGLLNSTNEEWHRQRKLLTPTFHYKILNDFVPIMNERSMVLVDCLEQLSTKGPCECCGIAV